MPGQGRVHAWRMPHAQRMLLSLCMLLCEPCMGMLSERSALASMPGSPVLPTGSWGCWARLTGRASCSHQARLGFELGGRSAGAKWLGADVAKPAGVDRTGHFVALGSKPESCHVCPARSAGEALAVAVSVTLRASPQPSKLLKVGRGHALCSEAASAHMLSETTGWSGQGLLDYRLPANDLTRVHAALPHQGLCVRAAYCLTSAVTALPKRGPLP